MLWVQPYADLITRKVRPQVTSIENLHEMVMKGVLDMSMMA